MPTLTLILRGQSASFTLEKIDRNRLYGYVDTETRDGAGRLCSRATLADDGRTLAGAGDTAITYLAPDGSWRECSELHAVDARDGSVIVPVKPTFAFPVTLDGQHATVEDYLAHSIRLVYQLLADPGGSDDLLAELARGTIYRFPFSYRGGDLADPAFLLAGNDGGIYLAVGAPCALDYASLNGTPAAIEETDEEEELDFSLI